MEGKGPLGKQFDNVWQDTINGQKSWEIAENKMLEEAIKGAIEKAGLTPDQIAYLLAGDLLNQIISANFAARTMGIPFIGLYGACSTMALGMAVGSMLIDGGFAANVVSGTSSHHDTAERQYRLPTEQGGQRNMSAQWTVTGAGSVVLSQTGLGPRITSVTIGRVVDLGEKDANNMGAAMAPAVADTILNHFHDLQRGPQDYDLIVSGNLGWVGVELVKELLKRSNIELGEMFIDCGCLVYYPEQDVHAGASGCGCSAVVMASDIIPKINQGIFNRVLFIGSGALHSTTSTQQGESIPSIGHAVVIET